MNSHRWYTPWLLVAPAVVWTVVFALYPFINTIILSFTNTRPLVGGEFIGFANYAELWHDDMFWNAMVTTFIYVIICIPLLTILPHPAVDDPAIAAGPPGREEDSGHLVLPHGGVFPRHRIGRRSRPHLELDVRFSRPY